MLTGAQVKLERPPDCSVISPPPYESSILNPRALKCPLIAPFWSVIVGIYLNSGYLGILEELLKKSGVRYIRKASLKTSPSFFLRFEDIVAEFVKAP